MRRVAQSRCAAPTRNGGTAPGTAINPVAIRGPGGDDGAARRAMTARKGVVRMFVLTLPMLLLPTAPLRL